MVHYVYYVTLFWIICHTKEQPGCNRLPPYPCCYDQYLNETSNTCTECPYGTFGWNCKLSCPSGFYGRLCKSAYNLSSSISNTHVTTQADLLQLSTITYTTAEVSTYQGNKPIGADPHIHYEDDHASPMSTLGVSLFGSFSSLCIIGFILFIHSRKKKWNCRASPNFSRIRQVLLHCVNQDRQQELIQGSVDIELSNVNASPVCGQEEDDSPYSEIRYSQFIGGANAEGVCINTAS